MTGERACVLIDIFQQSPDFVSFIAIGPILIRHQERLHREHRIDGIREIHLI